MDETKLRRGERVGWDELRLEWITKIASQHGIDTPKYILGFVLSNIVGDYRTALGTALDFADDKNDRLTEFKDQLDWITELVETPKEIKERLQGYKVAIQDSDWEKEEYRNRDRSLWSDNVEDFTLKRIVIEPLYVDAIKYQSNIDFKLTEEWGNVVALKLDSLERNCEHTNAK